VYGAFFQRETPNRLITGLMDGLSRERIEIDVIQFRGPAFEGTDHRLISLQLVEQGFTDAAMFTAAGDVVQPSEVLYKRPILVERGSFRPPTRLTLDLLERAREVFLKDPQVQGQEPAVLAEMTLRSLVPDAETGHRDFLARADLLGALGYDVLISRFKAFYEVAEYLAAYTDRPIGLPVGLPVIKKIVQESYYTGLPGGVLEAVGRLFQRSVKMYVYPTRDEHTGHVETAHNISVPAPWQHLHRLLFELGRVEPLEPSDEALLSIRTPDVLARIQHGEPSWESMVPAKVAEIIRAKDLFRNDPDAAGRAEPPARILATMAAAESGAAV
jgi:hypothetical protein